MKEIRRTRRNAVAERKLCLLFLTDRLSCATREQLWELAARLNLMEYIPCCMALQDLLDIGAIWAPNGLNGLLALTAEGYALLAMLMRQIPHSERSRLESAAATFRQELNERQSCSIYHEPPVNGLFSVRCQVSDEEEKLLVLWVRSPQAAVTSRVARNWRSRVVPLLHELYRLRTPGKETVPVLSAQEALAFADENPGKPCCALEDGSYSGVLRQIGLQGEMTLCLWECDRQAACTFASAAAREGSGLADKLLGLLGDGKEAAP